MYPMLTFIGMNEKMDQEAYKQWAFLLNGVDNLINRDVLSRII